MAPRATMSTVPVGEGERLRLPMTLMSPAKAVTRSVPGRSDEVVTKGSTFVSSSRSQGW